MLVPVDEWEPPGPPQLVEGAFAVLTVIGVAGAHPDAACRAKAGGVKIPDHKCPREAIRQWYNSAIVLHHQRPDCLAQLQVRLRWGRTKYQRGLPYQMTAVG